MKYYRILIVFLGIFILLGCAKNVDDGASFTKELIQAYIVPKTLEVSQYASEKEKFQLLFDGDRIDQWQNPNTLFKSIAEKYGDTHYNTVTVPFRHTTLSTGITAIKVTSDKEFDAMHPAGASLNDVVRLTASSLYYFVKDGYKNTRPDTPEFTNNFSGQCQGVSMMLNNLRTEELNLLSYFFELKFTTIPPAGEQTFTVTCQFDGEPEISASITVVY